MLSRRMLQRLAESCNARDLIAFHRQEQACCIANALVVLHEKDARGSKLLLTYVDFGGSSVRARHAGAAAGGHREREHRPSTDLGAHLELEVEELYESLHDTQAEP